MVDVSFHARVVSCGGTFQVAKMKRYARSLLETRSNGAEDRVESYVSTSLDRDTSVGLSGGGAQQTDPRRRTDHAHQSR